MMMKRSALVMGTSRDRIASASSNPQHSPLQRAATIQGVADPIPRATRILRLPQAQDLVGLRRSTIYSRIQNGEFPRPIKLGRTSGWIQAEIETWLNIQIEQSRRVQP
jgi:prophage regulatory protein